MGSKWIPISERLPEINENVWFLVNTDGYYDTWEAKYVDSCRTVQGGCRYSDPNRPGKGYSYSVLSEDMMDTYAIYGGETEKFEWGEVCEIIAWQPMIKPEVDMEVES